MNFENSSSRAKEEDRNAEILEHKAAVFRDRLLRTLKQLDRRWNDLFTMKNQVKAHPIPFAVASSGVVLALTGGITMALLESRRRKTLGYKLKRALCSVFEAR